MYAVDMHSIMGQTERVFGASSDPEWGWLGLAVCHFTYVRYVRVCGLYCTPYISDSLDFGRRSFHS